MYGAPSFIFVPLLSLFLFPVGTVRVRSWAALAAAAGLLLRREEKKSREKFSFELFQLIHQFYSLLSFYFFFFFFSGERGQLTSFLPCPFFYLLLPSSPSVHTDSRTFLFFCPPFHCLPKWSEEWACKEPATQHSS